jgi:hypothetical protein
MTLEAINPEASSPHCPTSHILENQLQHQNQLKLHLLPHPKYQHQHPKQSFLRLDLKRSLLLHHLQMTLVSNLVQVPEPKLNPNRKFLVNSKYLEWGLTVSHSSLVSQDPEAAVNRKYPE